jgi:Fic family protein
MTALKNFFTESPHWHEKIGRVHALLERVKISEEQSGDVLRLRKTSRILSVHASTAIEGNILTVAQVSDVVNNKPVWGPPKDIKEVQNAWRAYNGLDDYNPWDAASLLNAHANMTEALVGESGKFRTVGVAVVRGDGVVLHRGSPAAKVPTLVNRLLRWGETSASHPLIKSSAVHYMLEHIHPFRDGNGRVGRLWQTLILSKWNPLFAWMPVETLVHYNQAGYYKSLQESHANGVDCRPFIDFMMDAIENSLYKYVDIATETRTGNKGKAGANVGTVDEKGDGVNEGINVGVKADIITQLKRDPSLSAPRLAERLGITSRTVERHLQTLREAGLIKRVGSDKTGHWEMINPANPHE